MRQFFTQLLPPATIPVSAGEYTSPIMKQTLVPGNLLSGQEDARANRDHGEGHRQQTGPALKTAQDLASTLTRLKVLTDRQCQAAPNFTGAGCFFSTTEIIYRFTGITCQSIIP